MAASVPDGAPRCPECGGPVAEGRCPRCSELERTLVGERDAPLLARANLLRIRGLWEEAVEQCAEVLRANPDSATAHSLLGDIYQDQGRLEEARRWYRLALDLDPESRADRAKLTRVEETLEARRQRAEWEAVVAGRAPFPGTGMRESLQRVGAVAGAGLCAIVLVMALLVSVADRSRLGAEETGPDPRFIRRAPRPPIVPDTPRERELLRRLNDTAGPGPARAVRLEVDPLDRSVVLRAYVPRSARDGLTTAAFRQSLLREGYRLAFGVVQLDRGLRAVHVYLVGPSSPPDGGAEADCFLRAMLPVENLVVAPEKVTAEELARFYGSVAPPVWSPELGGIAR